MEETNNKQGEYATFKMTLTPEAAEQLNEMMNYLEIEILQGDVKKLPGGMTRYKLKIYDNEKAELIKQFMIKIMTPDLQKDESKN